MTRSFGAVVAVWRRAASGEREWLVLRRRYARGPEWRWTLPSGVREPGESHDDCARRELLEETRLELEPTRTPCGSDDWPAYVAEAAADAAVRLDDEHDDFASLPVDDALGRCRPQAVADRLPRVAAHHDR